MSHRRFQWIGLAVTAATLAITANVTGTAETPPMHAYFGSLGAYPFSATKSRT